MKIFAAYKKNITVMLVLLAVTLAPMASMAQTRISMPKNKYKAQDDIKLGRKAATEAEKQYPVLNDTQSTRYVEEVGRRLVASIPPEFQHPEFTYTFKIVNARDINAFALPGGPMYVNRGMIEAAKNEGEMAGVMAHEISHVALRHGTAQQTKLNNPLNQILGIGAILGGAVVGGQAGAQLGSVFAAGYFLRYSREYETQADTLGAQIMARAGYDPNDLANMFKTIERESGGSGGPDWLNSHPNPANRYKNIENEARMLHISGDPIKNTPGFEQTKRRLGSMPRARSMAEIEKSGQVNGGTATSTSPTMTGAYKNSVELPSRSFRIYNSSSFLQMSVPSNWKELSDNDGVFFAPEGAYGKDGITHGALLGLSSTSSRDLNTATNEYITGLLQGNSYLHKQGNSASTIMAGRSALVTRLYGVSPVTNRTEQVTIYTNLASDGRLFFFAAVSPQSESANYDRAFNTMRASIKMND
jgi:Zn-dependent protease with chaperone function